MCFLHKFHFEMLYVLEWPKNRNWLALEFPDRGVGADAVVCPYAAAHGLKMMNFQTSSFLPNP